MSGGGSSEAANGDRLSVVQLSRLHERVLRLREHLRAALLSEGPQLEMIVFTAIADLYENFYLPVFLARASAVSTSPTDEAAGAATAEAPVPSAEMRVATSAYTQDILAACLYLIDIKFLPKEYVIPTRPPPLAAAHCDENASNAYVSAAQREFCFVVFMYVCWSSASLPLKDVLQALYPLLDPGAVRHTDSTATPAAVESVIAVNLFSRPRFASHKAFIAGLLSGLVLSRATGVRALLRVLLLDDRVEADMTAEAAELVVRVLTAPPPSAVWVLDGATSRSVDHIRADRQRVTVTPALSVEAHMAFLAPQLLSLLLEHAEAGEKDSGRRSSGRGGGHQQQLQQQQRPRFLTQLEALHQRLPEETLEQRVHLFSTRLLNTLVRLPPSSNPHFPRCYRLFFYTNRYILSPGFSALSLRGDGPHSEEDVVAALLRLTSLVNGVGLGAGTGALSQVLPATAPGLLNLGALHLQMPRETAMQVKPSSSPVERLSTVYKRFLQLLLSNASLCGLTAHALVQACTTEPSHVFLLGNGTGAVLTYGVNANPAGLLAQGLAWLLLVSLPPPDPAFVHACVESIVEACQLKLCAAGVETLLSPPTTGEAADGVPLPAAPPLVLLLERLCLEAPSAAIFGAGEQLTLPSALALLGRVAGLSAVLYRWSVGMLNSLLTSDSLRAALQGSAVGGTSAVARGVEDAAEEQQRFLRRLVRTAESVLLSLEMLRDASGEGAGPFARVHVNDEGVAALAAQACVALQGCLKEATHQLSQCILSCGASALAQTERGVPGANAVAVTVAAQWQRLLMELQHALDCRAWVDVSILLTSLSRSVDDVVHDVADPQLLVPVVQPLLLALLRVLYEGDDVGCAVRAVHCVTWLCMYRFDSADSSHIADVLWAVLGEATLPAWLASHIGHSAAATAVTSAAASAKVSRLRVRLLDVLLAWTDYDEEARTLRNIDDVLRRTRHTTLYDTLVRLCHQSSEVFAQVATLHFIGAYAVAVYPRVPLPALCGLCRDIFRLSPHAMAKAACAAAVGKVVAALCHGDGGALQVVAEVDVEGCQSLASAMASYRGRPAGAQALKETAAVDMHDAVIQQHGRDILELLRRASLTLVGDSSAAHTPSAVKVEMPNVVLR